MIRTNTKIQVLKTDGTPVNTNLFIRDRRYDGGLDLVSTWEDLRQFAQLKKKELLANGFKMLVAGRTVKFVAALQYKESGGSQWRFDSKPKANLTVWLFHD